MKYLYVDLSYFIHLDESDDDCFSSFFFTYLQERNNSFFPIYKKTRKSSAKEDFFLGKEHTEFQERREAAHYMVYII